jgi:pimeloyl-ACP methyl ester carboxylesterase
MVWLRASDRPLLYTPERVERASAGSIGPRRLQHLATLGFRASGWRSVRVPTSAGSVHVLESPGRGRLPSVVLLHGLSSAGVEYGPLLVLLRGRVRRVIAPDLLGHGLSDAPAQITSAKMRDALVETLDHVLDEPAILFGNSLGGLAALRYALARPHRVRGLVLCSPGGAPPTDDELHSILATFRVRSRQEARAFAERLLGPKSWMLPFVAWGARRKFSHPTMVAMLEAVRPEDFLTPEHLSAIAHPTLIVWGRGERILPGRHLEYFRAHLPHAHIDEPEDFGHSPFLDRPWPLAQRILAFAASV